MPMLDFSGFMVLLGLSVFASLVLHYGLRYYIVPGPWSFVSKVIIGFVGGLIGPMIFGHWLPAAAGIPLVPALIGSFGLLILVVDITRSVHARMLA